MGKKLVFRDGKFIEVDINSLLDDDLHCIPQMPGIDWTGYNCFQQTSVSHSETSDVIIETMKEACRLARFGRIRFMTDALFLSGYSNINRSNMISLFLNRDEFTSFSHNLAYIIDQQERTESFSEEMSPLFIRQFEDANVIRKTRQAEKMQMSDILLSVLYSNSPVSELMKRYGIDNEKISRCC